MSFSSSLRIFRESADAYYDSLQGMVATAQDAVPDDIGALRAALTVALARAEDEAALPKGDGAFFASWRHLPSSEKAGWHAPLKDAI